MKTLWILEDHASLRRTLEQVFQQDPEIQCTASFGTGDALLRALQKSDPAPPDVILTDLGLPDTSGLELIPQVLALFPEITLLVLTVYEDEEKVFRALCAGASGYLLKTGTADSMVTAVREALAGGAPMSPQIARRVLSFLPQLATRRQPSQEYGLTEREREILRWLVDGLTKKELASRLSLSVHTIDTHLRRIYSKLHVHNRSGAVARALKSGLT
jgi:DNA-binding NarL/FixJ family response regulator